MHAPIESDLMDWQDVRGLVGAARREDAFGEALGGSAEPPRRFAPVPGLLEGLNEPQREACTHGEGPMLIVAGPGSGKTRVITHRIAWLVTERGVHPGEILAITFTNKAAREMRERVERTLPGVKHVWISTFHAMCARILRRDIELLGGWTRRFSIYDTSDRNQLIKRILRDLNYDRNQFRPAVVGGWISDLKNRTARELEGEGFSGERLKRVMDRYEGEMRANNALDFDDLLLKVLELFELHPGVRDGYARRFRHVLVDEYQDTNRVQYQLTRHLASHHGNLTVCGDPDQSIYSWRGADIRNILDFEGDFGARRVVKLEQNYRSKGTILKAASAVIGHNLARKAKELWTDAGDGEPIALLECADENEEGRTIALQIRGLLARGVSGAEIAVFYRASFLQRALETGLRLAEVPYQVVGGLEFYARREIRDLIAHLRLIVNPGDAVAFERVVNVPQRGVGGKSLEKLAAWAAERGTTLLAASGSEEARAAIGGRAKKGLAQFHAFIEHLSVFSERGAAEALGALVDGLDVGAWLAAMDEGQGIEDREENVEELLAHAAEYDRLHPEGKLAGFLEDVALVSDVDGMQDEAQKVALMTLHAAKGLEFGHVFIAGVEDEILPHARALFEARGESDGLEEERRLFYVGMTRAKERLYLSCASVRLHYGETRWSRPSRFLDEIPRELLEGRAEDEGEQGEWEEYDPPAALPELCVGDRVEHDHFGVGHVDVLRGSGANARATVTFVRHGTKELLLSFAKLRRISG